MSQRITATQKRAAIQQIIDLEAEVRRITDQIRFIAALNDVPDPGSRATTTVPVPVDYEESDEAEPSKWNDSGCSWSSSDNC